MARHTDIYPALKALDAANSAAIVAAAAQAFHWDPGGIAEFCRLISANPAEVEAAIRASRADAQNGTPWFIKRDVR